MIKLRKSVNFAPGDKVQYHGFGDNIDKGIVKLSGNGVSFVVYHCGGDWDNYKNYTAASTMNENLTKGWDIPEFEGEN